MIRQYYIQQAGKRDWSPRVPHYWNMDNEIDVTLSPTSHQTQDKTSLK